MLDIARLASVLLWLIPAALLPGSAWRVLIGRPREPDPYKAACWFMALLILGFIGRWYVAPGDTGLWAALYALSAALAVYVILLVRPRRWRR
jgi:hypothetical protein